MGSNIIVISSFILVYCQVVRSPKVERARVRGAGVCVVEGARIPGCVFEIVCIGSRVGTHNECRLKNRCLLSHRRQRGRCEGQEESSGKHRLGPKEEQRVCGIKLPRLCVVSESSVVVIFFV